MISASDIRTYVVNLPRRSDRRERMTAILPPQLHVSFTSDWSEEFDGRLLHADTLRTRGIQLFAWQTDSDIRWWNRPLKYGEIGCTLAHLACWKHAASHGDEPYVLIFEDDAVFGPTFLDDLLANLNRLRANDIGFDLLYLGRKTYTPDQPLAPGIVEPGMSYCMYGYLLTRAAVDVLLAANLETAIVPADEFLLALYFDHPRADVRTRFPRQLSAVALVPPIVTQDDAGSDTEATDFIETASLPLAVPNSDTRPANSTHGLIACPPVHPATGAAVTTVDQAPG
ncbi:glycosyltransferase family 25 protein [Nocardia sp. NPDC052566]|uniref:glycosyltransferase family 25 protein n=1 Tax=Nocardia sp. NPDC052566 TaxID=3364330 RepID=UPI0037C72C15